MRIYNNNIFVVLLNDISIDNTDDRQINVGNDTSDSILNINYSENELPGMELLLIIQRK